jgi:uncharacterized protein YegJ (DUF2314 family)
MNLKRVIVAVAVVSVFLGAGCSRKPEAPAKVPGEEGTKVPDEEGTKDAKAEAQATFEDFRTRVQKPETGDRGFQVKVEVKDENGTELVWINDLKLDAEPYSGAVASEPNVVKNMKWKDGHTFSKGDVCDWMYWTGGTVRGNYMARAALKSMPADQAERMRKKMGW